MSPAVPASPSLASIDITALKGVGKSLAEKLAKIQVYNLQDLLFHLPLRYIDRTKITPIGALQPGVNAVVEGVVKASDVVFGRRRSLMCRIQDGTGSLTLRFYHFSNAQKQGLVQGTRLRVYGEARRGSSGLEIYHPEYDIFDGGQGLDLVDTLTPIYPITEGLTQGRIRSLMDQLLPMVNSQNVPELIPGNLQPQGQVISLALALKYLHQPPADAPTELLLDNQHPYQQRLAFEELMAHNLSLLKLRQTAQSEGAPLLEFKAEVERSFLDELEFNPTKAQKRVIKEIYRDICQPYPMLRLVQGDVGSGKTLVAAAACLQAVANGYQAAIMAPTEILAEQHFSNFSHWFKALNITVGYLSGRQKVAQRRHQLAAAERGESQMIVGTHALFQQEVVFSDLALVVIDEQHRFGVHQRLSLRAKGRLGGLRPHQLVMTATPIPRTLAMSAYADLDSSIIDELPPGRTPVSTVVISNNRRAEVVERVRLACSDGRQAYWVCTLIEESETLTAQAAEVTAAELEQLLAPLSVALIHGKMKGADKEGIMARFKAGEVDLLVATTVIEVGVDVPNASLMIIENPERLGLAQLHQLRGRVGRGSQASHCVLMYGQPLSNNSRQRLSAMRETSDGFLIAEKDLELRGPGEVLGTRQTGEMRFKLADLQRDANLLEGVKVCAEQLLQQNPDLAQQIIARWLGKAEEFAQV